MKDTDCSDYIADILLKSNFSRCSLCFYPLICSIRGNSTFFITLSFS